MKKLSTMETYKLLEELNIDFKITNKCLYVYVIRHVPDYCVQKGFVCRYESIKAVIKRGLVEYIYSNFYEVMLWYRYYTCQRHHIEHTVYDGPDRLPLKCNASYFARLPSYYRNTPPNKGLKVVKEAMIYFITYYNGIPPYFDVEYLDKYICKIIN